MIPVITVDGPSGSGKGTISERLAQHLGWRFLDSGALYRLVGYSVEKAGIGFENVDKIVEIAKSLDVEFDVSRIIMEGEDVSLAIRTETAGNNASRVGAIPEVRQALLDWQRNYAQEPGLVADGRDMGTVVFPSAQLKFFLDASAAERAKRRYKQLKEKGIDVNLAGLTAEIEERDQRDRNRSVAPLKPAEDAIGIDSTSLGIEEVLALVLEEVNKTFPGIGV